MLTAILLAGPRAGAILDVHPALWRVAAPGGVYLRDHAVPVPPGSTANVAFTWAAGWR